LCRFLFALLSHQTDRWSKRRAEREKVIYLLKHDPGKLGERIPLSTTEILEYCEALAKKNFAFFGQLPLFSPFFF
jgi:hypothetical protein